MRGQSIVLAFLQRLLFSGSAALLVAALLLAEPFSALSFTFLVTFGDSYTDTGNFPSSPPNYWNGRFSNGPLWVEDLSVMLGSYYDPANNYAVSGSEANELGVAIANFPGTSDSANVLFAIWSGNNDFANHLNIGVNDAGWDSQINWIVSSLMTASDLLYQKGARNLVLFNQLDVTRCPDILHGYSASFRSYIRGKIQIFNSRLAAAIPGLLNTHPGLQVFLFDIYSDFNYLLDNYASYGFTQATIGAINDPNLADTSFTGPGANYVFWDDQHPTAKTHALIAGWVASVLPTPPPPTIAIATPQNGAQFTAPATLQVSADVAPNGWNVAQVSLYQDGLQVGTASYPPYTFTLSSLPAGTYTLTAQALYGSEQTVTSAPIQVTVATPPGSAPPAPWSDQDIGSVGLAGSSYYTPTGTFTVMGSGADIWGTADAFHYVSQPFTGDGNIVALVNSVQNTDGFAKAGLMFRETLDPAARNVMVFITPTSGTGFQDRTAAGGNSAYTPGISATAPYWLKLERIGATFNSYSSPDASQWTLIGSASIPMSSTVYAGLAVSAHNNSLLNTASFSGVQLAHSAPPVPPVLALTRSTNGVVQLTITGSVGETYVCQASTNLLNWTPISTNLNTSGTIRILPPISTPATRGFYRAVLLP